MSDTSTKRALEVAKFHEVSEELYADNPEDSGRRAMHHISANLLRALAAERDGLRAALQTARRDALEEAARRVEIMWLMFREKDNGASDWIFRAHDDIPTGDDFVAAIRALGEKE